MSFFWLFIIIALIILELSTAQLICIWFAGGALVSLGISFITNNILLQFLVFVVVSGVLLVLTKGIVKKLKSSPDLKTNSEALIGTSAVVVEDISNIDSLGAVKVKGLTWSARSIDDSIKIQAGTHVIIKDIDGVKLIVEKLKEEIKCY